MYANRDDAMPLLGDLATPGWLSDSDFGVGDDVFYPGLFTKLHGEKHMLPVLRCGTVAAIPKEQVLIALDRKGEKTLSIEAYVIEARSWEGFSGAPVFLYNPVEEQLRRILEKSEPFERVGPTLVSYTMGKGTRSAAPSKVIGIVSSYWDYDPKMSTHPVHAGLAIVVPIQYVRNFLRDHEVLMKERKSIREREERRGTRRGAVRGAGA